MCAKYATPPPLPVGEPHSRALKTICWPNHSTSTSSAGSSTIVKKKMITMSVMIRAPG